MVLLSDVQHAPICRDSSCSYSGIGTSVTETECMNGGSFHGSGDGGTMV